MMNNFVFENKTKVYFGKNVVKEHLGVLLSNYGETVMLAYGGGSIKCNGVYDEIMGILNAQGKRIVEFSGIMSNPTYQKVQEGAKLARENHVDLILAVGGGSVSDCCKVISAQANLNEDIWEMQYTKHTLPTKFIPPRHHRHGVRHRQRDEQWRGHHPRGKEDQGRALGRAGGIRVLRPGLFAVRSHAAGHLRRV